ncbi:MAG: hypothetical protein IK066_07465 [Kiritimatiellae bacterium]|nr:hypothetical protein [Kiritimatiellia bacterium]
MKKPAWIWVAAVALAVQGAGLGWAVARYGRVVTKGTEVRLEIPRDWFWLSFGKAWGWPYVEAVGYLECEHGKVMDPPRQRGEARWVLLEAETEGVASHRAVRFAKEPGTEGLWVKAPWYDWKWDEQDDSWSWNEETAKRGMAVVVGFPGKLFMDRRLAKAAEGVVEREEGEAVAVYRAWKGEMVITDVEIDGVSVKELARRARAEEG